MNASNSTAGDDRSRTPALETHNVHDVYEVIADHFSATRYRQWPVVERFLRGLPSGSLVTDVGCGNGKNMVDHWAEHTSAAATAMDAARTRTLAPGTTMVSRPQLFFSGSDRSSALAEICRQHRPNADVAVADTTCLPYRSRCFDVAISIAVIHHLATRARRLEAVRELLRVVRPGGQVLLYVWALEQRQMPGNRLKTVELPNCERTSDYDAEQDVLVPWNLNRVPSKSKGHEPAAESSESHREIHNRYYHLFRGGELEGLVQEAFDGVHGGFSAPKVESGYDRDNWFIIVTLPK